MPGNRFGRRIRKLRKKSGTSLRKFAEEMDMSAAYLSRIETGKFPPPAEDKIIAMADSLGSDRDELLALAGKVSSDVEKVLVENSPWLPALVRGIGGLSDREKKLLSGSGTDPCTISLETGSLAVTSGAEAPPEKEPVAPSHSEELPESVPELDLTGQQDLFSQLEGL